MFEIDDEEELLQQSLGDLCQCADEIMEQAGVCKGLRCVETIIRDIEHSLVVGQNLQRGFLQRERESYYYT